MRIRADLSSIENVGAVIDGLTLVPVYNYVQASIFDDLSWQGCNYAAGNRNYKYSRDDSYSMVSPYVLGKMRTPTAQAFNLTPSDENAMGYKDFYDYSDRLISEKF